jgi:hypothetical protein
MALRSEGDQLSAAWRALDRKAEGRGWQVIDLTIAKSCPIMAGRRGPGNEESLLVGIPGISLGKDALLPRGHGFAVVCTEMPGELRELAWLAVVRQQGGQLPLFTLMAADLVSLLRSIGADPGAKIYSQLISRIKAWQRFMSRARPHVLSPDEEVGLIGELVVLGDLIDSGLPETEAIEAWLGPDDGLHDFVLGSGGIEAKATVAPVGFVAQIGSLDQLDDSLHQPLYIGAVRLGISDAGVSLPALVDDLMGKVAGAGAGELLVSKLASAGYLPPMRDHYTRKFLTRELTYRLVSEGSPRLTRSVLPAPILQARYALDLDAFPVAASTFAEIAERLGVST